MSESRTQRSVEELIIAQRAKLEALLGRQAKKTAQSDPALAPLFEELEGQKKIIREAKKGLGKGPQSFAVRIQKHEDWIDKIELEQMDASINMNAATAQIKLIEANIKAKQTELASEENLTNLPTKTLNASN